MQILAEDLPFEVHYTPSKNKDGKTLYYVKPASNMRFNLRMIDDYCVQIFHLQRGELTRVLDVFMQAAGELMARGYRLELPFGTFAPLLKLKREITDPDDVTPNDVMIDGIDFRYNKMFKNEIDRWLVGFERIENQHKSLEQVGDTNALEQALQDCLTNYGHVTIRQFSSTSKLSYAAAHKQLDAWTLGDNPRLLRTKIGQQYIYTEI